MFCITYDRKVVAARAVLGYLPYHNKETMKRLTYISAFSGPLSRAEIENIGQKSVANNQRDGLTGALFCFRDLFYQILEGEEGAIDRCYARILADSRHKDIFCLNVEAGIKERQYGDWAMKTVVLEDSQEDLLRPLRNMMDSLARTHMILEKYAPEQIIQTIQRGLNPLEMKSFHTERVVLFADIMASTTLTESLRAEVMADILHAFYEIGNRAIKQGGGTISKLTGDGLMAHFTPDAARAALEASLEIQRSLAAYRQKFPSSDPRSLLFAGIGISAGAVLEGSIGSEERKDYTLLGDPVNSAARLESVTRKTGWSLVFDSRFRNLLGSSQPLKRLGQYQPKGKKETLEIFTVAESATRLSISPAQLRDSIAHFKPSAA